MYSNPNAYQPPLQAGYHQPHSFSGPPPAKKPKGNPIITRYPPPPGYKGPSQPQVQFQQAGWQQPYGYAQAGYPQQSYLAPQSYQQPQWPVTHPQQYPPNSFPPAQVYYPASGPTYPAAQPGWQAPSPAPQSAPAQPWQPPVNGFSRNQRRHNSAPFPQARNGSIGPLDGNGDPFPASVTNEDLEDDFDGECYFARHPDEVEPAFSLGQIEWHAALPTKLALPATFQEAELEALAPRKPPSDDEESISEYFVKGKREEAYLSVRQTDAWEEIKGDLIYRDFPLICLEILSMSELLERYRDRPDPNWTKLRAPRTATPTPEPLDHSRPSYQGLSSDVMDIEGPSSKSRPKPDIEAEQSNVLDNLEQALFPNESSRKQSTAASVTNGAFHSRSASVSSQVAERITRPKPLAPVRDQEQEDILAALGVTGSPKMVYQTPGPAFGAPPAQNADNEAGPGERQTSFPDNAGRPDAASLPAAQSSSPPYEPWKLDDQQRSSSQPRDHPESSLSHHTVAGSDFGVDDQERTPRPQASRNHNRKRSYDAFDQDDRRRDHYDDPTPKQRRMTPWDVNTYSRR